MNNLIKSKNRDVILVERIRELIKWDKRISNLDVRVIARSGSITLQGKLDSQNRKNAAIELVQSTKGVLSVTDQLDVPATFVRDDIEIENLIKGRISEINFAEKEHIAVEVKHGCVKLTGKVLSRQKKSRAAGVAWELSGVKDCFNFIMISGETKRVDLATPNSNTDVWEGSYDRHSPSAFAL